MGWFFLYSETNGYDISQANALRLMQLVVFQWPNIPQSPDEVKVTKSWLAMRRFVCNHGRCNNCVYLCFGTAPPYISLSFFLSFFFLSFFRSVFPSVCLSFCLSFFLSFFLLILWFVFCGLYFVCLLCPAIARQPVTHNTVTNIAWIR